MENGKSNSHFSNKNFEFQENFERELESKVQLIN